MFVERMGFHRDGMMEIRFRHGCGKCGAWLCDSVGNGNTRSTCFDLSMQEQYKQLLKKEKRGNKNSRKSSAAVGKCVMRSTLQIARGEDHGREGASARSANAASKNFALIVKVSKA